MSRSRGLRLQNALAAYLTAWWPYAESAGAGRPGTDVKGTPGIAWECKTADDFKRDFEPTAWVKQAKSHVVNGGYPQDVPVVVYFPRGIGEQNTANTLAILPLHALMQLIAEAGYTAGGSKYRG